MIHLNFKEDILSLQVNNPELFNKILESKSVEVLKDEFDKFNNKTVYNCDLCNDTGQVDVMEYVTPGEPHMAMVGVRKCECIEYEEERE